MLLSEKYQIPIKGQLNYPVEIDFGFKKFHYSDVIYYLSPFLSNFRMNRLKNSIKNRIVKVNIILEKIYDEGNIGAVLRSFESFGFLEVHVVMSEKSKLNCRSSKGSERWLNIIYWDSIEKVIHYLKNLNFKIVATIPPKSDKMNLISNQERELNHVNDLYNYDIKNLPLNEPVSIILGNEKLGVSEYSKYNCDYFCEIPLYGLTQSLNISVAAAICLYQLSERIRELDNNSNQYFLTSLDQEILLAHYLKISFPLGEKILRNFFHSNKYCQI